MSPASEDQALFTSGASSSTKVDADVDIEDIDDDKLLDVSSAIAVEKEIAADTIGTIFSATRSDFLPYVEQCTLELVALLPHYYEGIRKSATESLLEIIRTFSELSNPPTWQPGKDIVSLGYHLAPFDSTNRWYSLSSFTKLSKIWSRTYYLL